MLLFALTLQIVNQKAVHMIHSNLWMATSNCISKENTCWLVGGCPHFGIYHINTKWVTINTGHVHKGMQRIPGAASKGTDR